MEMQNQAVGNFSLSFLSSNTFNVFTIKEGNKLNKIILRWEK